MPSVKFQKSEQKEMTETKDPGWNEEEGILSLQEFKPLMPISVSNGIQVAKDPVKREELKRIFLSVLRSTAEVVSAAKVCQIPKSLAYIWRAEDPEFAFRWDKIFQSELLPHLEAEAVRRAMNGSDLLLMFMMKALDRNKYDDKVAEKTVSQPSITIQMIDVDAKLLAHSVNTTTIPAVKYIDGDILDGEKTIASVIEGSREVVTIDSGNEPATGTEGTSKE